MELKTEIYEPLELSFSTNGTLDDPYGLRLAVVFTHEDGETLRVPGFWDGGRDWKARVALPRPGQWRFRSEASPSSDAGLHGLEGIVEVGSRAGEENPWLRRALRVAEDRSHLERADGTSFFWMGDTWWMALCERLDDDGFARLCRDRAEKGFNLVQLIVGPYPDMDAWDERGRSPAGFPFTEGFHSVNSAFCQHADRRIRQLIDHGLVPCLVGMWGYYLDAVGAERVGRYWDYLVARYSAWPVVWCIAGEADMPYYLSEQFNDPEARQKQKAGWTEITRRVREADPHRRPLTIHPSNYASSRDMVTDASVLDFEMLQTGHDDLAGLPRMIEVVMRAARAEPRLPVINSEVNYEGIMARSYANVQRVCFALSVLHGVAGFTYGANGLWQVDSRKKPYGISPHGRAWGEPTDWSEAAQLSGGTQVAALASRLATLPWWRFRLHPEWCERPDAESGEAFVIGVPEERLVWMSHCWNPVTIRQLEPGAAYHAEYWNPCSGAAVPLGTVRADADGCWTPPKPPAVHDWWLHLAQAS